MSGNFITRTLLLGVGYAYPAIQCFKTVEKNRVGIEELRFWCKYWIIMALVSVAERSADFLISWLPLYGELKLALVVYLWHPKFSGTGHVYDTILRPFLAKHENDIDRLMTEMTVRGWDVAIFYWQYVAEFTQALFLQGVSCWVTQSDKLPLANKPRAMNQDSTRQCGPWEMPTPRLAWLSHTGLMNWSKPDVFASDAAEMSPDSRGDFIYVENHESEEDPCRDHQNLGPESHPPTPNQFDITDRDKDNLDINNTDSGTAMDDGKAQVERPKHRLHLGRFRHRRQAVV